MKILYIHIQKIYTKKFIQKIVGKACNFNIVFYFQCLLEIRVLRHEK